MPRPARSATRAPASERPITVLEAKTHLSRLIARALAGEVIVIHRGRTPVVKLVALDQARPERRFGAWKGKLAVDEDELMAPLPDAELAHWQ